MSKWKGQGIKKVYEAMSKEPMNWEEEFDERRFELKNSEGKIVEFGYKCLVGNEWFTITDWGNIKSFISNLLEEREKEEGCSKLNHSCPKCLKFVDPKQEHTECKEVVAGEEPILVRCSECTTSYYIKWEERKKLKRWCYGCKNETQHTTKDNKLNKEE